MTISGNTFYFTNSSTTSTTINTKFYFPSTGTSINTPSVSITDNIIYQVKQWIQDNPAVALNILSQIDDTYGKFKLPPNWSVDIELPDGTVLRNNGGKNFIIDDSAAKVVYLGNRDRSFNQYLNASDLLEDFIAFLGTIDVKQSEVMDIPIDVFIHWLIMKAALADGENIPDGIMVDNHPKLLPSPRIRNRCKCCARFISNKTVKDGFYYCNIEHYQKKMKG